LDTEQEIESAAEEIMKETGTYKLDALDMLFSRYESQRRLEEAARVRKIKDREESKAEGYGKGTSQDI
jgi:hypothetical protein